jgi:hypothetical protein
MRGISLCGSGLAGRCERQKGDVDQIGCTGTIIALGELAKIDI